MVVENRVRDMRRKNTGTREKKWMWGARRGNLSGPEKNSIKPQRGKEENKEWEG